MRNTWKVILGLTLALGFRGAVAQGQPLIAGNTAAFGCGPIYTSDFTTGMTVNQFYPDGAGPGCPDPPPTNHHNGRGMAVGGTEIFYTELDEIPGPVAGFGASRFVHVANFNSGAGSGDTRLLNNPDTRTGSGIQDLTFSNGILYVMTGYDNLTPQVWGLNLSTGAVLSGPVSIGFPASHDSDGFAVLPSGNFFINNGGTSCIYSQYNPSTGSFVGGSTMTVPGNVARCTGVDTDGTSLYFMTDFEGITRTDFSGNLTGFNNFLTGGEEAFIEDISLVHPVTSVTAVNPALFWIGLRNSDDIGTWFDLKAEILLNGAPITSGLVRCIKNVIRTPSAAKAVVLPFAPVGIVPVVSGDVLAVRVSTRVGTNPDDSFCGGHNGTVGLRLYYDSAGYSSSVNLTIFPNPAQNLYLRSDGSPCNDAGPESSGVTSRTLNSVVPVATFANKKCKDAVNFMFAGGNPFTVIGTLPVPAGTWSLAPQP